MLEKEVIEKAQELSEKFTERYAMNDGVPCGHGIECRFCGYRSAEHLLPPSNRKERRKATLKSLDISENEAVTPQKGFPFSLIYCVDHLGYVPKNIWEWMREERVRRREKS